MITIPKEVMEHFEKIPLTAFIETRGKVVESKRYSWNYKEFMITHFVCSCEESHGEEQEIAPDEYHAKCKYCNQEFRHYQTFMTENVAAMHKDSGYRISSRKKTQKTPTELYIRALKDEIGLEIFTGSKTISYKEDKEGTVKFNTKIDFTSYVKFIPGIPVISLKLMKRGENQEIDVFDALNINSQNISGRDVFFEGSENFWDFFENNQKLMNYLGMGHAMAAFPSTFNPEAFFVLHLALISAYPVLELLVKMNYFSLYNDIIKTIRQSGNKEAIALNVKNLNKLLNNECSKGSLALKLPKYIGDYLRDRNADLPEFIQWADIYERENISKENFQSLVQTPEYIFCNLHGYLPEIPNIMKYGYPIQKLLRYLYKEGKDGKQRYYNNTMYLLKDYHQMCELLDVEPEMFPNNLQAVHDHLHDAYNAKKNEINNERLKAVASAVNTAIAPKKRETLTKMEEQYSIVVPETVEDFIQEGNNQHNCVGHYSNSVAEGRCIIFFIRKKEAPEESFITAEYRDGHYGQVMYKNNVPVHDSDILNYCRVLCNKIHTAQTNKLIPGF